MRAIQIVGPRRIAMLDDAPEPEPAEGEVLVRCTHVGLCGSNISHDMGTGLWADGEFPNPVGWSGHENIGIIAESRCDDWEQGALVLANPEGPYGFAEYIVSRPPGIARLPQDAPDPAALVVAQPLATVLRALTRTGDSGPDGIDIHARAAPDGSEHGHRGRLARLASGMVEALWSRPHHRCF